MADHFYRRCGASEREGQIKRDRNGAAHIHIALERLKALRLDQNVVRIRRQIVEDVPPCRICRSRSSEARHGIGDLHLDRLHHAAGRILHGALNGSRSTQSLPDCRHSERSQAQHGNPHTRARPTQPHFHNTSLRKAHHSRDTSNECRTRRQQANRWSVAGDGRHDHGHEWRE